MSASGATAPIMFAKGQMLSSILFACSQQSAARAFLNEVQDWRGGWLNAFYAALSDFIRQFVSYDAEFRLTSAYMKASGKHGQKLTITKLLEERTVRNVLRECLSGFETPGVSDVLVACVSHKLDTNIDADGRNDSEHLTEFSAGQLHEFLRHFPDEIRNTLEQTAPT